MTDGVGFQVAWIGTKVQIVLLQGEQPLHSDTCDPRSDLARRRTLDRIRDAFPALDVSQIERRLLELATQGPPAPKQEESLAFVPANPEPHEHEVDGADLLDELSAPPRPTGRTRSAAGCAAASSPKSSTRATTAAPTTCRAASSGSCASSTATASRSRCCPSAGGSRNGPLRIHPGVGCAPPAPVAAARGRPHVRPARHWLRLRLGREGGVLMVIIGSDPIPTPPRYDRRDNGPVEAWLRMRPDRLPDAALVREKVLGMLRGIDHEILRVRERIRLCEVEIRERQAEREALRLVLEQALDDERIDALKRQSVAPAPKQARRRKAK